MERQSKEMLLREELNKIKQSIVEMGEIDCVALEIALNGIFENSDDFTIFVKEKEKQVDRNYEKLDESCIRAIALYQPIASDLRLIISGLKIASELERIGDYANNIAKAFRKVQRNCWNGWPEDLETSVKNLSEQALFLLKKSLNAYHNSDVSDLNEIMMGPESVKKINKEIKKNVSLMALSGSCESENAIRIFEICCYLDRIVDRSSNIAELVWYRIYGTKIKK